MIIGTFNCNSIKNRIETITEWMDKTGADIIACQETKCQDMNFPTEKLDEAGLYYAFRGEKTFNGVCLISRKPLTDVSLFIGDEHLDSQTRFVKAKYDDITVINTYIPQGQDLLSPKFQFKLDWLAGLNKYFRENYSPHDKIIWVGDFNIAKTDLDVYEPKKHWGGVGYNQFELDALKKITDWGFYDTFRHFHEGEADCFTSWDYRLRGAMERGLGWRIDYIMATEPVLERAVFCEVDREPRMEKPSSDHTPLYAEFDL
ncbi:MAG: exodeoxyribonuclease III [Armatimonadetes bacterium]|nr:exodeoxyribonuclease III [Candidatus Hippobium faecium]